VIDRLPFDMMTAAMQSRQIGGKKKKVLRASLMKSGFDLEDDD